MELQGVGPQDVIYCVAGGPSLRGFDFSRLRGRRCVAVNRSFEVVPWAEAVFFMDLRFWNWYARQLLETVPESCRIVTAAAGVDHPRVERFVARAAGGLETQYGFLRHGNSSGYAAVNLAYHLGARLVFLLGYDMRPDPASGRTHWHDGYPVPQRPDAFQRMLRHWQSLESAARRAGLYVANATPGSAIASFPFADPDEALEDPLGWLARNLESYRGPVAPGVVGQ